MKTLLLICSMIFSFIVKSQIFITTAGGIIPDSNTDICFPINVSGLPAQINSSYGLVSVCIKVHHTYDANLKIKLKSNNGVEILLVNNNGGNGNNFYTTCFAANGVLGSIVTGTAPFNGTFKPVESINLMNNNQNPNGIWELCIIDEVPQNSGVFISATLFFGFNPPPDNIPVGPNDPCSIQNGLGCKCPDGSQDCDLLPDMIASELIIKNEHTEYKGKITISNATPNIGWGPIEVHSSDSCFCGTTPVSCNTLVCPNGDPPKQKLVQTIYHKNGSTITSKDTLTYAAMASHPSHGHIHVDDWSEFTLRKATNNPNATTWPIVSKSSKVSFCLINLGDCNANPGYCNNANSGSIINKNIPNAPFGMVTGCGKNQGIFVGSYDVYDQSLPDMYIDLTGVCNGDYYLVSITDPNNYFIESDETNNWVAVPITLTKQIPKPKAEFTYSIEQGSSLVQFNNTPTILYDFYWDFGDGGTSNFQNPSHLYSENGEYETTLIIKSDCGNDTIKKRIIINNPSHYSVFPNPLTDNLNINYTITKKSDVEFELYNSMGQKVFTKYEQTKDTGNYEFKLNTNDLDLKTGVYILYIKLQDRKDAIRLVKL